VWELANKLYALANNDKEDTDFDYLAFPQDFTVPSARLIEFVNDYSHDDVLLQILRERIPDTLKFPVYHLFLIRSVCNINGDYIINAIVEILGYTVETAHKIYTECNENNEALLITTNLYAAELYKEQFAEYSIPTRIEAV